MTIITQSTEYALRALVFLAANRDHAFPANVLSSRTGVPAHYLGKVLQGLVRTGLLTARRGPGGGFRLAFPPEEITVLDIVNALDPIEHVQRCPLGRDPQGGILCPLHQHLEDAIVGVENAFRAATLAQLAEGLSGNGLCPAAETKHA